MPYYVYVMSNRTHVLCIGFTNDLTGRVTEHQAGLIAGFTRTYHLKRLVYFES
jgi:putative endonuclease